MYCRDVASSTNNEKFGSLKTVPIPNRRGRRHLLLVSVVCSVVLMATACIDDPNTMEFDGPDAIDETPTCDGEQTFCGDHLDGTGQCVDTDTDVDHCGGCDTRCTTETTGHIAVCTDGECTTECDNAAGFSTCGGDTCIDTNTDPDHCGICDRDCITGACDDGRCAPPDCDPDATPFGGGFGSVDAPFTICSPDQLDHLATNASDYGHAHFALAADIDLGNFDEETSWQPQGGFGGSLDGFGFAIENLSWQDNHWTVGLFRHVAPGGRITDLTIRGFDLDNTSEDSEHQTGLVTGYNQGELSRLTIEESTVTGLGRVGAVVGFNNNSGRITGVETDDVTTTGRLHVGGILGLNHGLIEDSTTGDASRVRGEHLHIGGLVGNNAGQLRDSSARGEVVAGLNVDEESFPSAVGGLVGINHGGGVISRSNAAVDLVATRADGVDSDVDWHGRIGGLVGGNQAFIYDSRANSTIESTERWTGGLVGRTTAGTSIEASQADGAIASSNSAGFGGLVGAIQGPATIVESFADVDVNAYSHAGGLVGVANDHGATIVNSYATGDVTVEDSIAGGLVGELGGTITHCYTTGHVDLADAQQDDAPAAALGTLVGSTDREGELVDASFWHEEETDRHTSPGGGSAASAENFGNKGFFEGAGWTFDDADIPRPRLQWEFND